MHRRSRLESTDEMNLVPILNLVSILIPFLLMAAQFVSIAVVDSRLERRGNQVSTVVLKLRITREGTQVKGMDASLSDLGSFIPCAGSACVGPEDYVHSALSRRLAALKDEYPDVDQITILPDAGIPFDVLASVMDTCREAPASESPDGRARDLFPRMIIGDTP